MSKLPFEAGSWEPGIARVAVIMISLNEAHNMENVLENLRGWAQEVFLVDSGSRDGTVEIALRFGVQVVQRPFRDFGDQWNFALRELPIQAPWTMKLDPDERLSDQLKVSLSDAMNRGVASGFSLDRHLWFMERPLPVRHRLVRAWRTGKCQFSRTIVNEYPVVEGLIEHSAGDLAHHDSPDLEHWLEKQNRYTTAEAIIAYSNAPLADEPRLLGTALQRRMWLKRNFRHLPFRFALLFLYYWILQGTWRAGWVGYAWARLRSDVMRLIEYKRREIELTGRLPTNRLYGHGKPDRRVRQYD